MTVYHAGPKPVAVDNHAQLSWYLSTGEKGGEKKDSEGVDSRGCTPGFISQDLTRDEESLGSPSPHAASLQLGSGRTFYNHPIFM